jgi:hypothetical protein
MEDAEAENDEASEKLRRRAGFFVMSISRELPAVTLPLAPSNVHDRERLREACDDDLTSLKQGSRCVCSTLIVAGSVVRTWIEHAPRCSLATGLLLMLCVGRTAERAVAFRPTTPERRLVYDRSTFTFSREDLRAAS